MTIVLLASMAVSTAPLSPFIDLQTMPVRIWQYLIRKGQYETLDNKPPHVLVHSDLQQRLAW